MCFWSTTDQRAQTNFLPRGLKVLSAPLPLGRALVAQLLWSVYCNHTLAVFGRPLRDAFSFVNRLAKYSNRTWRETWKAKEVALRLRAGRNSVALQKIVTSCLPLTVATACLFKTRRATTHLNGIKSAPLWKS